MSTFPSSEGIYIMETDAERLPRIYDSLNIRGNKQRSDSNSLRTWTTPGGSRPADGATGGSQLRPASMGFPHGGSNMEQYRTRSKQEVFYPSVASSLYGEHSKHYTSAFPTQKIKTGHQLQLQHMPRGVMGASSGQMKKSAKRNGSHVLTSSHDAASLYPQASRPLLSGFNSALVTGPANPLPRVFASHAIMPGDAQSPGTQPAAAAGTSASWSSLPPGATLAAWSSGAVPSMRGDTKALGTLPTKALAPLQAHARLGGGAHHRHFTAPSAGGASGGSGRLYPPYASHQMAPAKPLPTKQNPVLRIATPPSGVASLFETMDLGRLQQGSLTVHSPIPPPSTAALQLLQEQQDRDWAASTLARPAEAAAALLVTSTAASPAAVSVSKYTCAEREEAAGRASLNGLQHGRVGTLKNSLQGMFQDLEQELAVKPPKPAKMKFQLHATGPLCTLRPHELLASLLPKPPTPPAPVHYEMPHTSPVRLPHNAAAHPPSTSLPLLPANAALLQDSDAAAVDALRVSLRTPMYSRRNVVSPGPHSPRPGTPNAAPATAGVTRLRGSGSRATTPLSVPQGSAADAASRLPHVPEVWTAYESGSLETRLRSNLVFEVQDVLGGHEAEGLLGTSGGEEEAGYISKYNLCSEHSDGSSHFSAAPAQYDQGDLDAPMLTEGEEEEELPPGAAEPCGHMLELEEAEQYQHQQERREEWWPRVSEACGAPPPPAIDRDGSFASTQASDGTLLDRMLEEVLGQIDSRGSSRAGTALVRGSSSRLGTALLRGSSSRSGNLLPQERGRQQQSTHDPLAHAGSSSSDAHRAAGLHPLPASSAGKRHSALGGNESSEPWPLPLPPVAEAYASCPLLQGDCPAGPQSGIPVPARVQHDSAARAAPPRRSAADAHANNDVVVDGVRILGQKYVVQHVVGEGAYGLVMKCEVLGGGGKHVAIKSFKIEDGDPDAEDVKRNSRREVAVLRALQHPHVVGLVDEFYVRDCLFIVMEFVPCNLLELLEAEQGGMNREAVRLILHQLCSVMTYIHEKNVVYRDIKPENLLVDEQGRLKLCDFGFARYLNAPGQPLTDYVATRWYRAPELLLGPPFDEPGGGHVQYMYSAPIDMWAVGCLMGELMDGEPLFPGDSDLDQLYRIQQVLGPLVPEHKELFSRNPQNMGINFNFKDQMSLAKRYEGKVDDLELDFLSGLLCMDPAKRLTGLQCLQHPYLADLSAGSLSGSGAALLVPPAPSLDGDSTGSQVPSGSSRPALSLPITIPSSFEADSMVASDIAEHVPGSLAASDELFG